MEKGAAFKVISILSLCDFFQMGRCVPFHPCESVSNIWPEAVRMGRKALGKGCLRTVSAKSIFNETWLNWNHTFELYKNITIFYVPFDLFLCIPASPLSSLCPPSLSDLGKALCKQFTLAQQSKGVRE